MIVIRITDTPPQDWLAKAAELTQKLEVAKDDDERRLIMKANQGHWSKLKKWLQDRTHGKCWYSEAKEIYSHYHVDHFRPKSRARELDRSQRCGYWWLAFDWHNYRIMGSVGNPKKGDMFPLKPGTPCNNPAWRDCGGETYLLLDPTAEDDVSLVDFNVDGRLVPVDDLDDWEKMRVEKTVELLALDHQPLEEARRKVWRNVSRQIKLFLSAQSRLGKELKARTDLENAVERIREMVSESEPLSAVAMCCVLKHNNIRLTRLVTAPRQPLAA